MDRILITGGNPLMGRVRINGAKNSALKLMAAALLCDEPLVLTNMPDLADTRFMAHLLGHLGVEVERSDPAQMTLCARALGAPFAPYDLVRKMRATFNVLGPLLARHGQARVSLPGGCAIGARPVDLHLKALEAMGAQIRLEEGYAVAEAPKGLHGAQISFPFVSVGATEHAMLAAVLARGETVLDNAAREPEIADLAHCLIAMGAKIEGVGTARMVITGVSRLGGTTHAVVADRIEAGTYALAVAATSGDVLIENCVPGHLGALWDRMRAIGVQVEPQGDTCVRILQSQERCSAADMETQAYPGFPTDLQAQFMAVLCRAKGASIIRETIFENRFMHAPELSRLGADITVHGREAVVRGVSELHGAPVMATDLRASVSLVIAGLAAKGQTEVNRVYHLDRGFEGLERKLSALGADIERVSGAS
ncbi:MAG: UDP-N-acetylglucosamine 1-carboxyvinyltransferase [Robiginitomaculum sp.]|nr:MAG: UDP-N-acetylglucosamine 1-carboxyvinyltransferase [Robiginitomaculum sp.]